MNGQVRQHAAGDGGHFASFDLHELLAIFIIAVDRRAIAGQVTRTGVAQGYTDQLEGGNAPGKVVQAPVILEPAVMDDEDALAQGGHVGHVMAGE
jgi:hypothetical protein